MQIKRYREILRKKGLYVCLGEARRLLQPLWFTRQRDAIDRILQERHYRSLLRHYGKIARQPIENISHAEDSQHLPKIIWIFWWQGMDSAPAVVKQCYRSVLQYADDYEVRVITEDNMSHYIQMPDYIMKKQAQGRITLTHLSDILRVCLLCEYGGVWLDATVLLTSSLPDYIQNEPLFVFQKSWLSGSRAVLSSWCMSSVAGHPLLCRTRELLFAYWKDNNRLIDYFLLHLLFSMATTENTSLKALFEQIPYICNAAPHTLQFRLFAQYTEREWQQITAQSSVHKLTYKYPQEKDISGTFLQHILQ